MAALSHITKWYAVNDAKIFKLAADAAGAAAPVYNAGLDVPGIKSISIGGDINNKELRGDNVLLDSLSNLTNITATVSYGKANLDLNAILLGGATTDPSTTSGTAVAKWELTQANAGFQQFRLEASTPPNGVDVVGGSGRIIIHKAVTASFPGMGFAEEDYQQYSMDIKGSALASTGKWISAYILEAGSTAITRTVTDAVTATNTTLTSATAVFSDADIYKLVVGTGIPASTVITAVASATSATLSNATTASASGVTVAIG